jgi:hydroxyacylglutathione hydrolase
LSKVINQDNNIQILPSFSNVMIIKTFKGGYDSNCAYLIIDSDQALLIDPSVPANIIINHCKKNHLKLAAVVIMHSHHDHLVDIEFYRRRGIPLIGHSSIKLNLNRLIDESDTIPLSKNTFTVMHTPGHRFDAICLYDSKSKSLFTSDTLFVHGCGRIDFPGSDPEKMLETLDRLKRLPADTTIYPGHDYGPTPTSTIGIENEKNPYLNMTKQKFLKQRLGIIAKE